MAASSQHLPPFSILFTLKSQMGLFNFPKNKGSI
uniref:Uncharacterized protein n=1 Tax=Rhizophora mucronata TaxID=61149 RepID=A0A2P2LS92_RHIMU